MAKKVGEGKVDTIIRVSDVVDRIMFGDVVADILSNCAAVKANDYLQLRVAHKGKEGQQKSAGIFQVEGVVYNVKERECFASAGGLLYRFPMSDVNVGSNVVMTLVKKNKRTRS